ncbi:hemicentin-2-like, partial [Saccostrea cucullata]|uniref:hemicentin-2-like n=1 Tax=Saccostrea cuccullata TaxID=36930 RepID=UPI002ECFDE58
MFSGLCFIVGLALCFKLFLYADGSQTNPIVNFGSNEIPDVSIPAVLTLKTGDDVRIPCNTSYSDEKVTVVWSYTTGALPRNVQQNDRDLVITGFTNTDAGIYLCHVTYGVQVSYKLLEIIAGGTHISTATSFIPPHASITDHRTILYGDNVTLTCHVTGSPQPKIIWLFNDRLIRDNRIVEEGSNLHVNNITLAEDGIFTCVAKSKAGEVRVQTKVYVVGIMPVIDYLSESVYALTGSSVSFRCHASGIPKPKIFWYFISVTGEVGIPESNYQISPDHRKLTLHSARQSGTVWCIARNSYGATNAKAYLWIRL